MNPKLFVHKMWAKLFVRSLARQPTHGFKINYIQETFIGPRIRVAVTQNKVLFQAFK